MSRQLIGYLLMLGLIGLWDIPPAEAVNIVSQSESEPYPGVRVVEGRTNSPSTDFYAAFISLCHDHVQIDASAAISSQSSGQWASSVGAQLAVNGDFFAWGDHGLHVYGDAVGGGQRWPSVRTGRDSSYSGSWFYERYGWIAFGADFVEYSNTKWVKDRWDDFGADQGWSPTSFTKSIPEGTDALISGFPQLVVEGQPIQCSSPTASSCFPDRSDMRARHPRTAMGLSQDRNTFILVVVDGRNAPHTVGMYGTELADLMHQLGAHVAFNLDGGGSSQMWVQGQGTINSPSGGSPRSVPNSWGVFAGAAGGGPRVPGSCDRTFDEILYQAHLRDHLNHTDITGDGLAEVCARGPHGVKCYRADGMGGFSGRIDGPGLADSAGFKDPSNHSTMRFADVTGDGRADLCIRRNAGVRCYLADGQGFAGSFEESQLSNANGFDQLRYFSTIRMADVTGDGRADLCVRTAHDFRCYPSTGDGFGDPIIGPSLGDDAGWGVPSHYGTIRMGDVTGNGLADVCARRHADFSCWPATGDGFASRIVGPPWSNAEGWNDVKYWSTIEVVDIDGDGRADVCARGPDGIVCHLSEGDGFGPAIEGPPLADGAGWDDYSNYSTIRFADVDGEGTMDICARANAGIRCWHWDGQGFSEPIQAGMADGSGWFRERFFRTIRITDVTGDGRADLCARASAGFLCWPADGDGFADELALGPQWSDDEGWHDPDYYSSIRLAAPCPAGGCSDDEDGEARGYDDVDVADWSGDDAGHQGDTSGGEQLGGGGGQIGGGEEQMGGAGSPDGPLSTSSCVCGTSGGGGALPGAFMLIVLIGLGLRGTSKLSRWPSQNAL